MVRPVYQPHYRQIEQSLRERIAALSPGQRLPSDTELCVEFGVSRMTARNAMQRLADDGLVRREPGRGTFVANPPTHRRATRLMSFTQEMLRAGRVPSSRLLAREIRPSRPSEAASLGIPPRQPIVHLRRLRQADGLPIALENSVLIDEVAEVVMRADLARGSLHEALAQGGFVLTKGTATIAAAAATAEEARLLGIRSGDPLLVERRVIADVHGRRIEATESVYPADRYALEVRFEVEALDVLPGGSGS